MKLHLSKADRILESYIKKIIPEISFDIKVPVDDYIVDFLILEKKIVIEIDSGQQENTDAYVYHAERKEKLETLGLKVIRFDEKKIVTNHELLFPFLQKMLG